MNLVWFGFAGYPEIKRVARTLTADTRPGHFVGVSLGADVEVGDWRGLVCFSPGTPDAENLPKVIRQAKIAVEYHRAKQASGRV